jgi:uncharacterized protein
MEAIPFPSSLDRPAIGLTYSSYVHRFLERHPDLVDYVEMPFELMRYDPSVLPAICGIRPLILHCASLSMAGFVEPTKATISAVQELIAATDTPWLGEHLAFVTADPIGAFDELQIGDEPGPTNIGYTVSPVQNLETLKQVQLSLDSCKRHFDVPILLENGPVYINFEANTMSQPEFFNSLIEQSNASLLLDLTHFCITCLNTGADPLRELERFPVESVIEMHISGMSCEGDRYWDDHAVPASEVVEMLLKEALRRVTPKAITLEYNWSPNFPEPLLIHEFNRVMSAVDHGCAY